MVNRGSKVFVDSNVLIAAARGVNSMAERAYAVLSDAALRFVSSHWFVSTELVCSRP